MSNPSQVVTEIVIFVSYFALSLIILNLFVKNIKYVKGFKVIVVTVLTGLFLMLCALSHLSQVWGGTGYVIISEACALVSACTAVVTVVLRPEFDDMLTNRFRAVALVKDKTIIELIEGYDLNVGVENKRIIDGTINGYKVERPRDFVGIPDVGMVLEIDNQLKFRIVHKIQSEVSVAAEGGVDSDIESNQTKFWLYGVDETKIHEHKKNLDLATEQLFDLCLSTAHEIRTPLTSVLFLAKSLHKKPENLSDMTDELLAHTLILELLATNLLQAGRLLKGEILNTPTYEAVDVRKIFEDMKKTFKYIHGESVHSIFIVDEDVPMECITVGNWVRHIVLNFVMICLKYTTSTGKVVSRCSFEEEHLVLSVSWDAGQNSLTNEQIHDLFQISEYHGVGLYTVKKMVLDLGGECVVNSKPNFKGYSLTARFPIYQDLEEEAEEDRGRQISLSETVAKGNRVKKILVADDTITVLHVMKRALSLHQVDCADNGKEALEKMTNNHYDLVFMDLSMPIMGGLEATLKFRDWETRMRRPTRRIIIMMSATEVDRPDLFDFKLPKPIDHSHLKFILGEKTTSLKKN